MHKNIKLLGIVQKLKANLQTRINLYGKNSAVTNFNPSFKFYSSDLSELKIDNNPKIENSNKIKQESPKQEIIKPVKISKPRVIEESNSSSVEIVQIIPNISEMKSLYDDVLTCRACNLHKTRKNAVFGSGRGKIKLVCVGEAPGEDEDKSGLPFVGKAGQLLTKMLKAIGIDRNDIFICNTIKCHPPGNREPETDETKSCYAYLEKQLELLKPDFILALGRVAANRLLNRDDKMYNYREEIQYYNNIPVIVTYHPSALLRNEKWKRPAWEDLQKLQKLMNEK
ncbi:MAG: uracil-DNA glycosylase [Candidatus Delongbacteria bacterium]|nr:uracil-DNA glycosylase [Candidatus Delongbacteria bacterium]MBN2834486.1 uracil-DNA glycosylase [Candidatus Delongbacteria bacterium]